MIATLLATDIIGHPPATNLYQLDEPLDGFGWIAVTAFEPFDQSLVVGVTETGGIEAETVEALWHSPDAYVPHAEVLAAIGYEEI
ncbi:hypothetical protein FXW78_07020 [Rhodococcus opacus]|nr:hypothetical protein [Rhodococcus opacus]